MSKEQFLINPEEEKKSLWQRIGEIATGLPLGSVKVGDDYLSYAELGTSLQEVKKFLDDNPPPITEYKSYYDNTFFGHYKYTENGKTTEVDRNKYQMLAPNLYVERQGDEVLVIGDSKKITEVETIDRNTRRINIYTEDGELEQFYDCLYDDQGELTGMGLTIAEGAVIQRISSPYITGLNIQEKATVSDIDHNPFLRDLYIGSETKIGNINYNPRLKVVSIDEEVKIEQIYENPELTGIYIGNGIRLGHIYHNRELKELYLPERGHVDDVFISHIQKLVSGGTTVGEIYTYPGMPKGWLEISKDLKLSGASIIKT